MSNVVVDNVAPDGNGLTHIRQLRPDGVSIVEGPGGFLSAVASSPLRRQRWIPEDNQTVFVCEGTPVGHVQFFVNGLLQEDRDFLMVGNQLIWLNNGFNLAASDRLEILYNITV